MSCGSIPGRLTLEVLKCKVKLTIIEPEVLHVGELRDEVRLLTIHFLELVDILIEAHCRVSITVHLFVAEFFREEKVGHLWVVVILVNDLIVHQFVNWCIWIVHELFELLNLFNLISDLLDFFFDLLLDLVNEVDKDGYWVNCHLSEDVLN